MHIASQAAVPLRVAVVTAVVAVAMVLPAGVGGAAPSGDAAGGDTLGLYDPADATWYLRGTSGGVTAFSFGPPGALPVTGDWDGDGFDGPGAYLPETGVLVRSNHPDGAAPVTSFLPSGGLPVAGDADGDGRDEVAVVTSSGVEGGWGEDLGGWQAAGALLGGAGPVLASDVDGDGRDDLVWYDGVSWWAGTASVDLPAVTPGDGVVLGDWNGDGGETLAAFRTRNAEFWLYAGGSVSDGVRILPLGSSRMLPVAGRFAPGGGAPAQVPRELEIPPLAAGDEGPAVVRLQRALADALFYRGPVDGVYGNATAYAVMAFHKAAGLERTWDWRQGDTGRLAVFELSGIPDRPWEPDRIEVDVGRQVLFLIRGGTVAAIVPVSTGGGYTYYSERAGRNVSASTPRGDFRLLRYSPGKSCDPLYGWCIYNAWNFTQVYAIHGYPSVPAYPASHGCIRVPLWESASLDPSFSVGMPVHVWDEPPVPVPPVSAAPADWTF